MTGGGDGSGSGNGWLVGWLVYKLRLTRLEGVSCFLR